MCKRAVLLAKKLSVEGESFHFGAPVILLELLRENKKWVQKAKTRSGTPTREQEQQEQQESHTKSFQWLRKRYTDLLPKNIFYWLFFAYMARVVPAEGENWLAGTP